MDVTKTQINPSTKNDSKNNTIGLIKNAVIISTAASAGAATGLLANNYMPVADSYIKKAVKDYRTEIKKNSEKLIKSQQNAGFSKEFIKNSVKKQADIFKKNIPIVIENAKFWERLSRSPQFIAVGSVIGLALVAVGLKLASNPKKAE